MDTPKCINDIKQFKMVITKGILNFMVANCESFNEGDTLDNEASHILISEIKKDAINSLFQKSSNFMKESKRWFTINVTYECSCCGKDIVVGVTKSNISNFDYNRHLKISNTYFGNDRFWGRYHNLVVDKLGLRKRIPICQECYDNTLSIIKEEVFKIGASPLEYLNNEKQTFINLESLNPKLFDSIKREQGTGKILKYTCNITGETYVEPNYKKELEEQAEIRRKELAEKKKREDEVRKRNDALRKCDDISQATELYIQKFCIPNASINIKDINIQNEALNPSSKVDLNVVKTHNMSKLGYKGYLQTPLWKIISYRVKLRDGFKCQGCGRKSKDVHHMSYDHCGVDFLAMHRLKTLCRDCHQSKHEDGKVEHVSSLDANDSQILYGIQSKLNEEITRLEENGDIIGGIKLRELKKLVTVLIDRYL